MEEYIGLGVATHTAAWIGPFSPQNWLHLEWTRRVHNKPKQQEAEGTARSQPPQVGEGEVAQTMQNNR